MAQTIGRRVSSTVLVMVIPVFLLGLAAAVTGGGIGTPELLLLLIVWMAGLTWVWWPRRG
jgi:hypothetical protein